MIISAGYEVSAIATMTLDKAQAEEFLEVYKQVTPLVYHFLYAPPHLIDWRASAAEVNPLTTSSYISLVFTFLPYIRSYQMIPPHSHPHALSPIFL